MKAIEISQVTKSYKVLSTKQGVWGRIKGVWSPEGREVKAVDNLSFDVEQGEILGFIGPNGAGKSTTIKMLCGILTPTSGKISVLGIDSVRDRRKLAFRIGTVFGQRSQLWIHLPPLESFRILAEVYEVPGATAKRRIDELIQVFDLAQIASTPVRKLSLGQRIRCEMAASLIHSPSILFLDEPTIGLDAVVRNNIRDFVKRMNEQEGTTVILTSHDLADIERLSTSVIIINGGRKVYQGSVSDLNAAGLGRKIVSIKTDAQVNLASAGVKVLKQDRYQVTFEADTRVRKIESILSEILSTTELTDITIADPPLEELIVSIYNRSTS